MNIEPFEWYSPNLGRVMQGMRYGHWGPPILYFPTSGGGHTEFDYYRLQDDVWPFTEAGRCQFFVIDGNSKQSWYNRSIHPRHRVEGHLAYERFVIDEAVPFMRHAAGNDVMACMGFSFGGYYAANTLLRYPQVFRLALTIGGVYDVTDHLDGYFDQDVYFNNPMSYVPNLDDPWYRSQIGHTSHLALWGGAADQFLQSTLDFHRVLVEKGIPHDYDIWGHPFGHNERWWKVQVPVWVGQHY
ncbi:MAG: prolyl oligopeptidase family serine peptidase [Planctomycetes bacterium]|nr:prolyl oligopeptidase family serine peptidase [Planctomycetota bacterium]